MTRWIGLLLGLFAVLLGGLWTLQGLGVVQVAPILCVAECEAIEGPAPAWAVAGILLLMVGALAMLRSISRLRR